MKNEAVQTDLAPSAIGPYSQAVRSGSWLFVSGQIPLDPKTGDVVKGGIAAETKKVLENLGAILGQAGGGYQDVVKTTIFLKDMAQFSVVNEVYASFFKPPYPARATVEVSRLPKDVNVEIEAVANLS